MKKSLFAFALAICSLSLLAFPAQASVESQVWQVQSADGQRLTYKLVGNTLHSSECKVARSAEGERSVCLNKRERLSPAAVREARVRLDQVMQDTNGSLRVGVTFSAPRGQLMQSKSTSELSTSQSSSTGYEAVRISSSRF